MLIVAANVANHPPTTCPPIWLRGMTVSDFPNCSPCLMTNCSHYITRYIIPHVHRYVQVYALPLIIIMCPPSPLPPPFICSDSMGAGGVWGERGRGEEGGRLMGQIEDGC
jgi:hypothetical protein